MILDSTPGLREHAARSEAILSYWFATLDDSSELDSSAEPFRTCYRRWYAKDPAIDAEMRDLFEDDYRRAVARLKTGASHPNPERATPPAPLRAAELDAWARAPLGLLSLVILLDQFPRNMYRGTPSMYAHDALALSVARLAIGEYEERQLPLVRRMFLHVPLMHVEDRTVQAEMTASFEQLVELAARRCRGQRPFFDMALGSARRHAEVVRTFGRFPHRNAILGRPSTPEEEEYLRGPDPGF
jgi:uncharacterized protein (DUF924 family)